MTYRWRHSECTELIKQWKKNKPILNRFKKNAPIYKAMAAQINKKMSTNVTGKDVNMKIANFKRQYRAVRNKSSDGSETIWWAYDLVHEIIGGDPANNSTLVTDKKETIQVTAKCKKDQDSVKSVDKVKSESQLTKSDSQMNVLEGYCLEMDESIESSMQFTIEDPLLNSTPADSEVFESDEEDDKESGYNIKQLNKRRKLESRTRNKLPLAIRAILKQNARLFEEERRERALERQAERARQEERDIKFNKFIETFQLYIEKKSLLLNDKLEARARNNLALEVRAILDQNDQQFEAEKARKEDSDNKFNKLIDTLQVYMETKSHVLKD